PELEKQGDFFVPVVMCDLPIKDEVSLLDFAPYRLSPRSKTNTLYYKLNDAEITVAGSEAFGLAHTHDYDIVIHMISHLNAEMRAYERGLRPNLPPRSYRPYVWDMLRFLRRDDGKAQYLGMEESLERSQGTSISIKPLHNDSWRRKSQGFGLIDGWEVVSKTNSGLISSVEIGIPRWIYDGVVKERPSLLTFHPDFFLLRKPLGKTLYRLARKTAGEGESFYSMKDVHYRSGSTQPSNQFARDVRELLADTGFRILDYDFKVVGGNRGQRLEMEKVSTGEMKQRKLPLLKTSTYEKVKKVAPGCDVYGLEAEWRQWVQETDRPLPDNADAAFINFCKQKVRGNGSGRK
ncbi:MAG: hypothetical protein ETSY1_44150, partial [Candidatus Entotheonella factor]